MIKIPRISFGIIVLNGEPFTRYNLRALYPFAHQIIVVEGAAPGAAGIATSDGHSRDSTLESIRDFQDQEDPEKKLILVTAEDEGYSDGFWPGEKDQMSQAYARRATGDYLWQVDVDEFYHPQAIERLVDYLKNNPETTAATFKMITFWGGFDYITDGWYLRRGEDCYHRLFKWGPGYQYATHRPPTVLDEHGRDLRTRCWLKASDTSKLGIFLQHYSLVFPKQVREKIDYYQNASWARRSGALQWFRDSYETLGRPYRVHNVYQYPSWLERFKGHHPIQIREMINDLNEGHLNIDLRKNEDVDQLLLRSGYHLGRCVLKSLSYFYFIWYRIKRFLIKLKKWIIGG